MRKNFSIASTERNQCITSQGELELSNLCSRAGGIHLCRCCAAGRSRQPVRHRTRGECGTEECVREQHYEQHYEQYYYEQHYYEQYYYERRDSTDGVTVDLNDIKVAGWPRAGRTRADTRARAGSSDTTLQQRMPFPTATVAY